MLWLNQQGLSSSWTEQQPSCHFHLSDDGGKFAAFSGPSRTNPQQIDDSDCLHRRDAAVTVTKALSKFVIKTRDQRAEANKIEPEMKRTS